MSIATPQQDIRYPVVYNVVAWVRVLMVVMGLAFSSAWTYMSLRPPYAHGETVFNPVLLGIDVLIIAGFAYGIAWAFTARISLYADRFEQDKPFVHRMLELNNMAGRRYTAGRGSGYPVIVPKTGRPFSIDKTSYGLDERFNRWFQQIPDLQKIERDQHLERIRNDTVLGATPDERIAANTARRKNFVLIGVLLAIASFLLFLTVSRSHEHLAAFLASAAILPWATLFLAIFYRDQTAGPDGKSFIFLPLSIILPALAVGVAAIDNARLMHPKGIFIWGLAMGIALMLAGRSLLAALSKPNSKSRDLNVLMVLYLPFAFIYASGTLALANRTMDSLPAQIVSTEVVGKYVQHGKSSTNYYLQLENSAVLGTGPSIRVERGQYAQAIKGKAICVAVHPGRLSFPWMEAISCPDARSRG